MWSRLTNCISVTALVDNFFLTVGVTRRGCGYVMEWVSWGTMGGVWPGDRVSWGYQKRLRSCNGMTASWGIIIEVWQGLGSVGNRETVRYISRHHLNILFLTSGAKPEEVAIMNGLTVNLHLLMVSTTSSSRMLEGEGEGELSDSSSELWFLVDMKNLLTL